MSQHRATRPLFKESFLLIWISGGRNQSNKPLLLRSFFVSGLLSKSRPLCCIWFRKTNHLTNKLAFHSHCTEFYVFLLKWQFACFPSCRSSHQGVWEERECEGSQRQNYVRPWHKGRVNRRITVCVLSPVFTFHSSHLCRRVPFHLRPLPHPSTLTLPCCLREKLCSA